MTKKRCGNNYHDSAPDQFNTDDQIWRVYQTLTTLDISHFELKFRHTSMQRCSNFHILKQFLSIPFKMLFIEYCRAGLFPDCLLHNVQISAISGSNASVSCAPLDLLCKSVCRSPLFLSIVLPLQPAYMLYVCNAFFISLNFEPP